MPVSPKSRRCRCWEGKTGMAALTKWAQTLGVSGAAYPAVALPVAIPKGRATILGIPSLRVSAVWPCRLWDKRDQSIVVWTSRTCRTF
jgi:hypothetical protein